MGRANHALPGRELGAPDPEGDGRVALERGAADLLESPAEVNEWSADSSRLVSEGRTA